MTFKSNAIVALLVALYISPSFAHTSLRSGDRQPLGWAPPTPEGEAPEPEDDGAYKDKSTACQACRFAATGSCAMFKTCVCHATNAFFGIAGVPEPSDKDNWHWGCGNGGGAKYELCFEVKGTYMDTFGDKIDPNNLKCP